MKSIHIFRRDLRLEDNTALLAALEKSEEVIPCFIFDPRQVENNEYFSQAGFQFLITSLKELDEALKNKGSQLYIFYGKQEEILKKLFEHVDAVFFNKDYTPFARKRDATIEELCKKHNKKCFCYDDALLNPPERVLKADGTPYTVFTPFYRVAKEFPVDKPRENTFTNFSKTTISGQESSLLEKLNPKREGLLVSGGRYEALKLLHDLPEKYDESRDDPNMNCSQLSAHHKFGTISIRESFYAGRKKYGAFSSFLRELYWRDFFTQIAYHFPQVFGHAFNKKYEEVPWSHNKKLFQAWCEGKTGFPIVDAGMRELNQTGYMHNRLRMVVASFLTKDLQIDWRLGEKYFAQQLTDYDPCVNNGSWQWAASTGCDAQPYFRIFNPWLQQKKHDPNCEYIKKWIPELKNYSPQAIHKLAEQRPLACEYPEPIVDHSEASKATKEMFKSM